MFDLLLEAFLYCILSVALLAIGYFILDLLIPCNFGEELFNKKNPAVGVLVLGLFIAIGIIIRSSVIGLSAMGETFISGVFSTLIYSALGIGTFAISYCCMCFLARKQNLNSHIEQQNIAVATAVAGVFIAIALAISGAIQ